MYLLFQHLGIIDVSMKYHIFQLLVENTLLTAGKPVQGSVSKVSWDCSSEVIWDIKPGLLELAPMAVHFKSSFGQ